jgi:hypothetical protein
MKIENKFNHIYNSWTKIKYTCYELSKNNVLGVTYLETDIPESLPHTPRVHNIEIKKLTLNNDDVTDKLYDALWMEIEDHINENELQ